jgi:hypothetical protein
MAAVAERPANAEADMLNGLARSRLGVYGHRIHGIRPAAHHEYWIEPLQELEQGLEERLLMLAPPGGAKSTWISLTFVPWYLGNHPDHSLMFFTSSDGMAFRFGTAVKDVLESEQHALIFPDPKCRPDMRRGWSSEMGMWLKGTPVGKDPAIVFYGWGKKSIGSRANGIVLDDVLDQDDSGSDTIMTSARAYYDMTIEPRLKSNTQQTWIAAIMTSWNERDMAHFLAGKKGFQ